MWLLKRAWVGPEGLGTGGALGHSWTPRTISLMLVRGWRNGVMSGCDCYYLIANRIQFVEDKGEITLVRLMSFFLHTKVVIHALKNTVMTMYNIRPSYQLHTD